MPVQKTVSATINGREFPVTKKHRKLAYYGLLVIIFLSAIPFGTVDPIYRSLLIISACIFAAIRIVQGGVDRSFRFSQPAIFLPLIGILVLGLIQIFPVPFMAGREISTAPYETKNFIVTFAAIVIVGEVLFFYVDSRNSLKALTALVLITGCASAVFGALRGLVLDDHAGIATQFGPESQSYAQFINRNHFVFLMEMSLGLTVGLLLRGNLTAKLKILFWLMSTLFLYASIAANSRGGLISIAALGLFAIFIHMMTRRGPSNAKPSKDGRFGEIWRKVTLATLICCLVLGGFVFAISFVGGDDVVGRLEMLPDEFRIADESAANRLSIWRATVHMINAKPLLGAGFGGFGSAVTFYDETAGNWIPQQAHNEYLEILANGGVVAFTLFGLFVVMVVRRALRVFTSDDALVHSSRFGALIGVFGVMVHSFVDFGLHVMINSLVFVVLIVIATAPVAVAARSVSRSGPDWLIEESSTYRGTEGSKNDA